MIRIALLAGLAGLIVACAPTPGPSSTPPSRPTPSPSRAATPTPAPPPDTLTVQVIRAGVGAYMLEARPVALLHNAAARHTASGVVVHFTVHAGNGSAFPIDSTIVSLAPGETLGVSAECTDTCNHATGTDLAVNVTAWSTGSHPVISSAGAAYACESCGRGSGTGTVSGTLAGNIRTGSLIYESAICVDAAGSVVGGGLKPAQWPPGATAPASVAVLVSAPPAACELYATLT